MIILWVQNIIQLLFCFFKNIQNLCRGDYSYLSTVCFLGKFDIKAKAS